MTVIKFKNGGKLHFERVGEHVSLVGYMSSNHYNWYLVNIGNDGLGLVTSIGDNKMDLDRDGFQLKIVGVDVI